MKQEEINEAINAQESIILDRESKLSSTDYIAAKIAEGKATKTEYADKIAERQQYLYPPFTKIIMISLKHKDERELDHLAVAYTLELRKIFGSRVLGPEKPLVGRVATYYIRTIMLKVEANASMNKVKGLLRQVYETMSADRRMRSLSIHYDVDPV